MKPLGSHRRELRLIMGMGERTPDESLIKAQLDIRRGPSLSTRSNAIRVPELALYSKEKETASATSVC